MEQDPAMNNYHLTGQRRMIERDMMRGGSRAGEALEKLNTSENRTKLIMALSPIIANGLAKLTKSAYIGLNDKFGHKISGDKFVPSLPGESPLHLPGFNFLGPGSSADRVKNKVLPVNEIDAGARRHDMDYGLIKEAFKRDQIDRPTANKFVRQSDDQLQAALRESKTNGLYNNIIKKGADWAISGKKTLEDLGLLDEMRFVGSGVVEQPKEEKKKSPLHNLKKEARKLRAINTQETNINNQLTELKKTDKQFKRLRGITKGRGISLAQEKSNLTDALIQASMLINADNEGKTGLHMVHKKIHGGKKKRTVKGGQYIPRPENVDVSDIKGRWYNPKLDPNYDPNQKVYYHTLSTKR
jgi:hypothetical protein